MKFSTHFIDTNSFREIFIELENGFIKTKDIRIGISDSIYNVC